jgi:RNA polymerase sigma-70 factor (ECF subfamily)
MGADLNSKSVVDTMRFRKGSAAAPARVHSQSLSPSFEALFLEHWTHVYGVVLGLVGDPAEAEDLALEAFWRLYQRYPTPLSGFNVGGWLTRVAGHLGLRSIRSYKRRERYEQAAGRLTLEDAPENRPAEIQAREEERRRARMSLARMNSRQAELLVLRYSGFTYQEIAQAMGLAPSSVGPLLLRAERAFEKCYRSLWEEEG